MEYLIKHWNHTDLPRVNRYLWATETENFCKVLEVENYWVTLQSNGKQIKVQWKTASDRDKYLKIQNGDFLEDELMQVISHKVRVKRALSEEEDEHSDDKFTLIGKEGEVTVLKGHAMLVSDSFKRMIIRAKDNQLKVELGAKSLEIFKDWIHCQKLSVTKLDSTSFAELVDVAKMYIIDHFMEILVKKMTPRMKRLSDEDIHRYLVVLMRLPTAVSISAVRDWVK